MNQTSPDEMAAIATALGGGLPNLLLHFVVAVALLILGILIYLVVTPFR